MLSGRQRREHLDRISMGGPKRLIRATYRHLGRAPEDEYNTDEPCLSGGQGAARRRCGGDDVQGSLGTALVDEADSDVMEVSRGREQDAQGRHRV